MNTHQRQISVEPTTDLTAQMHELKRLRDLVRRAQLSAKTRRISAQKKNSRLEKLSASFAPIR